MKYFDLDLMKPINGKRYQCQVEAEAGLEDYHAYVQQFNVGSYWVQRQRDGH